MPVWLIVLIVVAFGGITLVGVLASIAIFGARRYLAAAKTAEAKNTVGAISRSARIAFERERFAAGTAAGGKLCGSAIPVPASVPEGTKYMPGSDDFATGDDEAGWKCLRFSMSMPIYYQYHYNQGGNYVAPAAGSPGASGFEAAAVGDLDGDGDRSLFAITGTESGGVLTVSSAVHIENEHE